MVWGGRLRPCGALALALALTACSSGPGGGAAAPESRRPSTTTIVGVPDLHDDVVLAEPQPGSGPSAGPSTTTARGRTAARSGDDGGDLPSASGATATTTAPTTTTLPPGLPAEKCPEPKTCRHYAFGLGHPAHWPIGPDGRATIEYWINPTGANPITAEEVEGAIAAAFATWQRAAPTVRFVYKGRTNLGPVFGDGVNVVAFNSATTGLTTPTTAKGGKVITEFDMQFRSNGWVWAPCEQRDGSCTPYRYTVAQVGGTKTDAIDLQAVATHEAGHVLWLQHPEQPEAREMTMSVEKNQIGGDRFGTTLGLGDVLGVRALYPCSCPLPPIYDP